SLAAYANDTVKVRFNAVKFFNGFFADIAIDDVSIMEQPTCPKPSNLAEVSTTENSITINWNTGGATNWQIRYRPSGSSGPYTIVPANSTPFTITGLLNNTTYEIWVRDSCAAGDVSLWVGPEDISTDCGVSVAPWLENFDGAPWQIGVPLDNAGDIIDPCWSRVASGPRWGTGTGPTSSNNTGPASDVSGSGNYIYRESSTGLTGPGQIISPPVSIPNTMVAPQLYFYYHMFGNQITAMTILVSNLDGSKTTQVSFLGQQQTSSNAPWIEDSLDLANFIGDTVQITFNGVTTGFLGDIAIDEVRIDENPICADPTNLLISNVTTDSAEVSWTSGKPSGSNLVYYDLSAGPGSAVILTDQMSPVTLLGLSPNTTYVIAVFDSCSAPFFASDTISDTITTLPCPTLSTGFTHTNNLLTVAFDGSLSINADSLLWLFGDGTFASGLTQNHTYSAAGTYTVSLITFTDCGLIDSTAQEIDVCDTLAAAFTETTALLTGSFDASTSVNPDSLFWTFGDGNSFSGGPLSNHTYATAGTYTVWLYAFNNCGIKDSASSIIKVCDPLIADFTFTRNGDTIVFDAGNSSGYSTLQWDFGDGTNGGGIVNAHLYQNTGVYTVTLTLTNECGETVTSTQTVQLCVFPVPSWTYTIISTTSAGMEVQFDGSASQNASIFRWDFGDGNSIVGPVSPLHTYLIPSLNYLVSLTVQNNCGDKRTHSYKLNQIGIDEFNINQKVEIYPNPVHDHLFLEWNPEYSSPEEIILFDIQGKQVLRTLPAPEDLKSGTFEWRMGELAEGVYIVNLKGAAMDIRLRVVIKH
ncbi:MAG: PKD domain-containing protein, partial [Owenweeksia sp.]